MPYDTFRLEPGLGDELWLVDPQTEKIWSRVSLVNLFRILGGCAASPVYSRTLAMEMHFNPRCAAGERVYWSEQPGVAAEVMQLMRMTIMREK